MTHATSTAALLGALALVVSCTSAPPLAAAAPDVVDIADTIARKTVALYGEDHLCTGVWVGARAILTASHCIDPGAGLAYSIASEHDAKTGMPTVVHEAHLYRADLDHDLALYVADGVVPPHLVAILGGDRPVGTELFFSGHVFAMFWSFRHGYVSAYRGLDKEKNYKGPWMQASACMEVGDSGGGAFDVDGYLVGMTHSLATRVPCVAFLVKGSTVRAFVEGK